MKLVLWATASCLIWASPCWSDETVFVVHGTYSWIDHPVPHMYGDKYFRTISIGNRRAWLTGASIAYTSPERPEVKDTCLCHGFGYDAPQYPPVAKDRMELKIVFSQGVTSTHFPQGFGLPLEPRQRLALLAMTVDPNFHGAPYRVKPTITVSVSNEPLKELSLILLPALDTHHVPPGVTTYRSRLFPRSRSLRLHYAMVHVHAYAQSVEIKDVTDGRQICFFKVETEANGEIRNVPAFSSVTGISMIKGHVYQTFVTYDNRTHHDIDVMADVFFYVR